MEVTVLLAANQPLVGQLAPVLAVVVIAGGFITAVIANPRLRDTLRERTDDLRTFAGRAPVQTDVIDDASDEQEPPAAENVQWWDSNFEMFREPGAKPGS